MSIQLIPTKTLIRKTPTLPKGHQAINDMHTFRMLTRYLTLILTSMDSEKEKYNYAADDLENWEKSRKMIVDCLELAYRWTAKYKLDHPTWCDTSRTIADGTNQSYLLHRYNYNRNRLKQIKNAKLPNP